VGPLGDRAPARPPCLRVRRGPSRSCPCSRSANDWAPVWWSRAERRRRAESPARGSPSQARPHRASAALAAAALSLRRATCRTAGWALNTSTMRCRVGRRCANSQGPSHWLCDPPYPPDTPLPSPAPSSPRPRPPPPPPRPRRPGPLWRPPPAAAAAGVRGLRGLAGQARGALRVVHGTHHAAGGAALLRQPAGQMVRFEG
jgi:hypothetical protein